MPSAQEHHAGPPDYPFGGSAECPLSLSPLYERLRSSSPVSKVALTMTGGSAWLVTGYGEVMDVLRGRAFSRKGVSEVTGLFPQSEGFILGLDGAEHRVQRNLVGDDFKISAVERLRPRIEKLTHDLVDAMVAEGEPADLVDGLAYPLALNTVGEMLGVPEEDRGRFRAWGNGFLATNTGIETPQQAADAQIAMVGYLAGLLTDRAERPTGDLLSRMVERNNGVDGVVSLEALTKLAIAIMVAGWETTASAISSFTYWLLTNGEDGSSHYERLRDDREGLPTAVEELLRAIPNGIDVGLPRRAVRDVRIGGEDGVMVQEGDIVIPSHDAANQDPRRFPDRRIDLRRSPNPHLAFGHGPHVCLGAHLARVEITAAIGVLLDRLPGLTLSVPKAELRWNNDTTVRGPIHLPVVWG